MPIYLDHNASTPPHPEVVEAMLPWLGEKHANPHSDHVHGRLAARAVEEAKEAVAELIGASAGEIVFTSGATEASNLAIQGLLRQRGSAGRLIYSAVEHPCVDEVAHALSRQGTATEQVAVDRHGRMELSSLRAALGQRSGGLGLLSFIHGNNEIGTLQAAEPLVRLAHDHGALVHVDASQSLGWVEVDAGQGFDLATLSSHKIGGPAGIGALYVADGMADELTPLVYGGGQQGGLRPGTIPVFLAVGFGVACRLVGRDRAARAEAAECAADAFMAELTQQGVAFERVGCPADHLPGLRSIRFPGVEARDLLDRIQPSVSASASSACASGEIRASRVLRAIGLTEDAAMEVARFGFGANTDVQAVRLAAGEVCRALDATTYHSGISDATRGTHRSPRRRIAPVSI